MRARLRRSGTGGCKQTCVEEDEMSAEVPEQREHQQARSETHLSDDIQRHREQKLESVLEDGLDVVFIISR